MRAMVLERFGEPLVLRDVPKPVAGAGMVLVRVAASGVNPLDVKIAQGAAAHAKIRLPAILGLDLAGTVEAVGPGVEEWQAGDEVYGMTGGVGELQGSLAEYAAVDARLLARKPEALAMREAAAVPLTFITAWEGLVDRARLREGESVLVHGGAGGVGNMAVQLASAMRAHVFATVSTKDFAIVEAHGATAVDRNTPVASYVATHADGSGFDVIYDTLGGATLDASFAAVRVFGGHVVSCFGWGSHSLAPLSFRAATYSGVFTLLPMLTGNGRSQHGKILQHARALADEGRLRPRIDASLFELQDANDAHARQTAATGAGKVVVTVDGT